MDAGQARNADPESAAPVDTASSTVFLVRHTKAGDRSRWTGDDALRPLSGKGRRQAVAVCDRLHSVVSTAPEPQLLSSSYLRCRQTLEPLAARLHSQVLTDERLTEGNDYVGALELISSVSDGSVLCSHGDIIPAVIAALERRHVRIVGSPDWRKGSVWVLERASTGVLSATVWPPPDIG